MKYKLLIILTSFILISCGDEFGLKSIRSDVFLLLPNTDDKKVESISDIEAMYSVGSSFFLDNEERYNFYYGNHVADYIERDFNKTYELSKDKSLIYRIELTDPFLKTRRDYQNSIKFTINGTVNGEKITETFTKDIFIDYLKGGEKYYYLDFQFESEKFGPIKALYRYYFLRTI